MPVKPRCTFKECKTAAQRIVGDCGFCDGHFCAKHRLLEDHKCTGLEDVSLTQSAADAPDNTLRCGSPSSLESSSTGESLQSSTQWWLVGLAEYLSESVQEGVTRAQRRTTRGREDTSHPGCVRPPIRLSIYRPSPSSALPVPRSRLVLTGQRTTAMTI
ncbi:hypothetical protein F4679DRAFT_581975 [Xylaria curta]|nr:hypothetical protein F4679DRAFT_581975 [Xylaria curta]